MKAKIIENIGIKTGWLTFTLMDMQQVIAHEIFEGLDSYQKLMDYLNIGSINIRAVEWVDCFAKSKGVDYLIKFENVKSISILGFSDLTLPDLSALKNLETIFFNQTTSQLSLNNLATGQTIIKLYFGDFTFGKAVEIRDFEEIIKCSKLEELYFGNVNFPDSELNKLKSLKSLKKLTLNQKYTTERFAELSVLLSDIDCNEFKSWQMCVSPFGDIKINGKRKPFLNSQTDSEKIKKYELEFEELRKKYIA